MRLTMFLRLAAGTVLATALASAAGITYTCDASIAVSTCTYLNTTIAGLYSSTFTNATANIYVQSGPTSLAATSSVGNYVSYSAYVAALTADGTPNSLRASALASLGANAAAPYGGGDVEVSTALGATLGFANLLGVDAAGTGVCNFGGAGCYSASVTVTNDPATPLYYRVGLETADEYDFYSAIEHETNEVLGSASCIATTTTPLSNGCGGNTPSAVDLFRYSSTGNLILNSSLSTTPGAYFSFDGGLTNGANGNVYNTLDNGEDYADFLSNCPAGPLSIQDAEQCPGTSGMDITNDGGAEINILNAVGYNLNTTAAPEPGTLVLLSGGLLGIGIGVIRRRKLA